jgi:hypothetical protein
VKLHADPSGKETEVPMNDWIDVSVRVKGGEEVKQRVRLLSGENHVRITTTLTALGGLARPGPPVLRPGGGG